MFEEAHLPFGSNLFFATIAMQTIAGDSHIGLEFDEILFQGDASLPLNPLVFNFCILDCQGCKN
jgi:hypothetical protein